MGLPWCTAARYGISEVYSYVHYGVSIADYELLIQVSQQAKRPRVWMYAPRAVDGTPLFAGTCTTCHTIARPITTISAFGAAIA